MKKNLIIFFLFYFAFSAYSFGQTYSYARKEVKANVQTSSGNEYKVINAYQGPYRFVFETPRNYKFKRLFTLLRPNENLSPGQPWYGLLKDEGYVEELGVLFKQSAYYYTGTGETVVVLITDNYDEIRIYNNDGTSWVFTNK